MHRPRAGGVLSVHDASHQVPRTMINVAAVVFPGILR